MAQKILKKWRRGNWRKESGKEVETLLEEGGKMEAEERRKEIKENREINK